MARITARRFLALAQENPKSPARCDALGRVLLCSIGRNSASEAAIEQLERDWTTSPRMAEIIFPISTSMCPNAEGLLRDILTRNPDRNARGPATLTLAALLQSYASLPMQRDQDPGMAEFLIGGMERNRSIRSPGADLASLLKESDELYERRQRVRRRQIVTSC